MKRFGIMMAIVGFLLFAGTAYAAGDTKSDAQLNGDHGTQMQQDAKGDAKSHNMTPEENSNMDMNMNMDQMEGNSGSHGAHKEVVETPPNTPVLATFGAINAAFLLIGVWNKWFRKKERVVT